MFARKNRVDYYEFLQISPSADQDTIHRVYRFLAARFHPDNPSSGDAGKFSTLSAAYEVLSDPARRAEYDEIRKAQTPQAPPLSTTIDFMDNAAGELNRRLAVLALLYFRRRSNPLFPEVTLAELEMRMGFPRDYLDFTTWYLQKKGYITKADNSDFTLTATGVDFVEMERARIPILQKLLTNGAGLNGNGNGNGHAAGNGSGDAVAAEETECSLRNAEHRMILLPDRTRLPDRRKNVGDRRTSSHDRRTHSTEQRLPSSEHR